MIAAWLAATHVAVVKEDGFYYLQIARQLARTGLSTFDGINLTNGYHPLWLLALVPIFGATSDLDLGVVLVTLLQGGLFAVSTLVIYLIARKFCGVLAASLAATTWVLISHSVGLSGLEFEIHALGISLLVLLYLKWFHEATPPRHSYLVFGLVAAVTFLARLETLLLAAILGAFLALSESRSGLSRTSVVSLVAFGLPVLLVALTYGLVNLRVFGHPTPVSGALRYAWSTEWLVRDPIFQDYGWLAAKAFNWLIPLQALGGIMRYPLSYAIFPFYLSVGTFGIGWLWLSAALSLRRWVVSRRIAEQLTRLHPFILYSVISYSAYTLVYHGGLSFAQHYFVIQPLLFALLVAFAFETTWKRVNRLAPTMAPIRLTRGILLVGAVAFWLSIPAYTLRTVVLNGIAEIAHPARDSLRVAASWIDSHLPEDAIVGVWNAGTIGYYSSHRIINLDGLANSWQFYERDRNELCDYWRKQGITYLVDMFDDGRGNPIVSPAYTDYRQCKDRLELIWEDLGAAGQPHHRAYRIQW